MTPITLPAPVTYLLFGASIALFAGAVRGFAGFGLSAFIVAGMSLWMSPQQIVPAAMTLEVLASLSLLRSVWPHIEWRWVRPLAAGYLLSVPLVVWCLSVLPELPLRVAVATVILGAAVTLLSGRRPTWRNTIGLRFGTGLAAGFLSGLSSVGGVVVAMILFSTELPAARLRATLISLFFMSSLYGIFWTAQSGLYTASTLRWVAWLFVLMLLGIAAGRHGFARASEARFRSAALGVLATVAAMGLVRALSALV